MGDNSIKIGSIMLAPLGAGNSKKTKVRVLEIQGSYAKVEYIEPLVIQELGEKPFLVRKSLLESVGLVRRGDVSRIERWIAQNMREFPEWINTVFLKYRVKEKSNKNRKEFTSYQKFIREYLQVNSPYRGLLLYHGLGSGKTCSSIAVAESIDNNVIVLSPATLKSNYVTALKSDPTCGVDKYKANSSKLDEKYTFISYNAPNTIEQLNKISSLDNHVIIIDEVHNLISMIVSGSKKGPEIYRRLMDAKNVKIVALSGTPIINYPFEVSILANILRGHLEVVVFFIQEAKNLEWQVNLLREKVIDLRGVDYMDNNQRYVNFYFNVKSHQPEFDELVKKILDISRKSGIKMDYLETKRFTLFPDDEDEFRQYFVEETLEGDMLKNMDMLKRRMMGLISYYRGGKAEFYPVVNPVNFERVEMSDFQYNGTKNASYKEVREIEKEKEKSGAMMKLLSKAGSTKTGNTGKKVSSLFRVFSRQFSNFVFPDEIERPFVRKFIRNAERKKLERKAKKSNNAAAELEELQEENKRMNENKIDSKDRSLIDKALRELGKKKDVYLVDGENGLRKYSPKMARMLENIKKSRGKVIVYSTFRSLEGIGVFELVLQANGYEKFDVDNPLRHPDIPKYAIYSGVEDESYKEKVIETYNSKENLYGEIIKCLLISAAGAEGLDLKATRQVHIMEPYWHDVRIDQVIGRANRFMSHIDLPLEDRTVDVYRYMTVFKPDQLKDNDEKMTTDEYIYDVAMKKLRVTEQIKKTMKEISVDCVLNAVDNERDLKCFSFGLDAHGLGYKADLKEDYVYGKTEIGTKEVTKKLEPMFLDDDNNLIWADKKRKKLCYFNNRECKKPLEKPPKNVRKVGVDMKTLEVYDVGGVGYGNLIKLGVVDGDGKLI